MLSAMRTRNLVLPLLLLLPAPAAAEPHPVRWGDFVTMMQGNTLSGTTAAGTVFNMYFIAGGNATYQEVGGTRDFGTWHLDKEGDVCVVWKNSPELGQWLLPRHRRRQQGRLGRQGCRRQRQAPRRRDRDLPEARAVTLR